jgi:hypothetical protein
MMFLVGFLFMLAMVGVLFYLLVIYREVPGAVEQRFGVLEPLPGDVNEWKVDEDSPEGRAAVSRGLRRETRLYQDPSGGFLGRARLIRQTRYRNRGTNAITSVEPDVPVKRRRIRS